VAVLVVATPCPLILAAPVALVSGLSRAARRGIVIKGGAVLERLARCITLLIDRTGTLTRGRPALAAVIPAGPLPPGTFWLRRARWTRSHRISWLTPSSRPRWTATAG
jgi:cation transport ATPase